MKTEPESFSFDDLMKAPRRTTGWDGVRNYQARNFMRDEMRVGDRILIYHSSANPPGVAGIAEVASAAYPDRSAFDRSDPHYDPDSRPESPQWMMVDVRGVEPLPRFVSLEELRANPKLATMRLLQRGNRLSITPVTSAEFREVCAMAATRPKAAATAKKR
jgi:predicted RNA-binding protein with PUA-like domain